MIFKKYFIFILSITIILLSSNLSFTLSQGKYNKTYKPVIPPRPWNLTEAGGDYEINFYTTNLDIKPYAASLKATSRVQVKGLTGKVKKLMILLNTDRRVTDIKLKNQSLYFTHVGSFLVVDITKNPLSKNEIKEFIINYTGKIHSFSDRFVRGFFIRKCSVDLSVVPRSGNLEVITKMEIEGKEDPITAPVMKDMYTPPPLDTDPSIILSLNNNFVVDSVTLDGQEAEYSHVLGDLIIKVPGPLKNKEKRNIEVKYTGKIQRIDRILLWDTYESGPYDKPETRGNW